MTDTAVEPEVIEAQTENTEATEAEQAEALAKAEASLELFQHAAHAAIEEADTTTGTLPEAALEPVKVAYRGIDGGAKFKNKAKTFVADAMRDVLSSGDLSQVFKAVAWNSIQDAILTAAPKASTAPKVTVSPNKVHADKVQSLRLALDLIENSALPEGVTEEWEAEIDESDNLSVLEEYTNWVKAEKAEGEEDNEPEVSPVIKAASKLALSRGPKKAGVRGAGHIHTGPKRDVGVHISNAFDQVEEGTFLTVSEIRNTPSEEYGSDAPSAGAINQRLRPPSGKPTTIAGIRVEQNADGVWGATKV